MNRFAVALAPLILAASAFSAQAQDPHAGHVMPTTPAPTRPAPEQVAEPQTPARPVAQDSHAGHVMPPAPTPPPAADPHAGHDMSTMQPAQTDPHAGHDMSAMSMGPPDVPTSANDSGRPPETPVPAAALSGPTHAADLVFGAEAMAASRQTLIVENGDVRTTAVIIDRLEAGFGDGGDINRFWWKSEGEGDFGGNLEKAELQALYSRAITPFWDVQARPGRMRCNVVSVASLAT